MDNTDDAENPTTETNTEPLTVPNRTLGENMNGSVSDSPESAYAAVITNSQADATVSRAPEDPPIAVTQLDINSNIHSSPLPIRTSGLLARRQASIPASNELSMNSNIDMPDRANETEMGAHLEQQRTYTQTPDPAEIIAGEGPLTPRNDAGPFVFDGSAGRSDARQLFVPSLAQVADGDRSLRYSS